MSHLIDTILSNSFYKTISIILILFLFFFMIKKLFKLVVYGVILFACFLAYVHFTGGNVKNAIEKSKIETENAFKKLEKK